MSTMKRYGIFDEALMSLPKWADCYCVDSSDKPFIVLPKPICWLLRANRLIRIKYREIYWTIKRRLAL